MHNFDNVWIRSLCILCILHNKEGISSIMHSMLTYCQYMHIWSIWHPLKLITTNGPTDWPTEWAGIVFKNIRLKIKGGKGWMFIICPLHSAQTPAGPWTCIPSNPRSKVQIQISIWCKAVFWKTLNIISFFLKVIQMERLHIWRGL